MFFYFSVMTCLHDLYPAPWLASSARFVITNGTTCYIQSFHDSFDAFATPQ